MPVSRKRKKKSSSGRGPGAPTPSRAAQVNPLRDVQEHRRRLDLHRTALAAQTAGPLVDALVTAAAGWSDDQLEDDFCARFGAAMAGYEGGAIEDLVNPEDFVRAVLIVLDERLSAAGDSGADVAATQRALTVVAGVLPPPLSESAADLVTEYLDGDGAQRATHGRALTGPAQWARDAYGTRWAVVAPFASADGVGRWYLWDVDTCGFQVVTVHSGFHPSAEAALAAWQHAVGPAADAATLTPADDAETLRELLVDEVEDARFGGEDQSQYAEFLRGRRLGRTVRQAVGRSRGHTLVGLSADTARVRFAQRLRHLGHQDGQASEGSAGAGDLAAEMAESWSPQGCPSLYPYCSPHKVAATVLHLRDYYRDEFVAELVAVLPEWIRFLAEHTGMTADLTERCLAYASGDREFPGLLDESGRSDLMARVVE